MSVASISGTEPPYPVRQHAAPVPQLRTTEADQGGAHKTRAAGKPTEEQVQSAKATKKAEPAPDITSQATRFRVDEDSHRIVTEIIGKNNEVVRQIPQQDLLDISAKFKKLQGLLFDHIA